MQEVNITNLYQGLPAKIPAEIFETLAENGNVKIERIISDGHSSPPSFWYDQDHSEWVLVLDGAARLEYFDGAARLEYFDGTIAALSVGDALLIPAHAKHRVAWTAARTVWLAVHF